MGKDSLFGLCPYFPYFRLLPYFLRGRPVKLFNDPLPKYGALVDALGPRDSAELAGFSRLQFDTQRPALCAHKNGFRGFLQVLFKVC